MSEAKTHQMKMARATKSDLDNARLAYQILEAYYRDDCTTRKDFNHFEDHEIVLIKSIFKNDQDQDAEVDLWAMNDLIYGHLLRGFFRILWGYEVMFANACDPDEDVLEFKPWIIAAADFIQEIHDSSANIPDIRFVAFHERAKSILKLKEEKEVTP